VKRFGKVKGETFDRIIALLNRLVALEG